MRIVGETHIPFLSYRWYAIAASSVLMLGGLALILFGPGLNLGIDFVGGTQVTVKFQDSADLGRLRTALAELESGKPLIQRFDEVEKHEVMIRVQNPPGTEGDYTQSILEELDKEFNAGRAEGVFDLNRGGALELTSLLATADPEGAGGLVAAREEYYRPMAEAVLEHRKEHGIFASVDELEAVEVLPAEVRAHLQRSTTAGGFALLGAESVGPSVGADLRDKAQLAMTFSLLGMLVYIWIRFQLPFGVGAVAALGHDVLVTLGFLALTQREINLPTIAALLTLVGYSVNDTVVVFDRVRENLRIKRSTKLRPLMDLSVNQTLSRTIMTSGTTLIVVLSLYLFGGDVINTFAFVLLIGIIVGTYSTVFIASPVALWMSDGLARMRERRRARR